MSTTYNASITAALPARIGHRQDKVLNFVANHPGCCAADVDRATNSHVVDHAHAVTYDAVRRLIARGLLRTQKAGSRVKLFIEPTT